MSAAATASRCSTSSTTPTRSAWSTTARLDDPAEAERNKISPYRGFWSITLGGAEALYLDDMVGNFAPGKEADFVVLDWNGGPPAQPGGNRWSSGTAGPSTIEQAADLLFGLMMVGDDRAIDETWVIGAAAVQENVNSVRDISLRRDILTIQLADPQEFTLPMT